MKEPVGSQYVAPALILGKNKTLVNVCSDVQQRAPQPGMFSHLFYLSAHLATVARCQEMFPSGGLVPEMIPTSD